MSSLKTCRSELTLCTQETLGLQGERLKCILEEVREQFRKEALEPQFGLAVHLSMVLELLLKMQTLDRQQLFATGETTACVPIKLVYNRLKYSIVFLCEILVVGSHTGLGDMSGLGFRRPTWMIDNSEYDWLG